MFETFFKFLLMLMMFECVINHATFYCFTHFPYGFSQTLEKLRIEKNNPFKVPIRYNI